jgi:hypothetical protein
MTVGLRPLALSAVPIQHSGELNVRVLSAAGASSGDGGGGSSSSSGDKQKRKAKWHRKWCTIISDRGLELSCSPSPPAPHLSHHQGSAATTTIVAVLSECDSVRPSTRAKPKANEMELVCNGKVAAWIASPPTEDKRNWGRALTTAMLAAKCGAAADTISGSAVDGVAASDPGAAALPSPSSSDKATPTTVADSVLLNVAAAVAFTKLGARGAAAPYWAAAASAAREPHLLLHGAQFVSACFAACGWLWPPLCICRWQLVPASVRSTMPCLSSRASTFLPVPPHAAIYAVFMLITGRLDGLQWKRTCSNVSDRTEPVLIVVQLTGTVMRTRAWQMGGVVME